MDNQFWGPGAWDFLHSVTFDYPEKPSAAEKKHTREFFHSLKYVLPCLWCRKHYKDTIEKTMPIEPHLGSRNALTRWLVDLHNSVNKRLKKPQMPYDAVYEKFESMRATKCKVNVISSSPATCDPNPQCDNTVKKASYKTNFLLFLIIMLIVAAILFGIYGFQCLNRTSSPSRWKKR